MISSQGSRTEKRTHLKKMRMKKKVKKINQKEGTILQALEREQAPTTEIPRVLTLLVVQLVKMVAMVVMVQVKR